MCRTLVLLAALVGQFIGPASARDGRSRLVPPGWTVGHVSVTGGRSRLSAGDRELTIQRGLDTGSVRDGDLFYEGTISYGDVEHFVPAPSVDSGRQLPYGLDGIGGYGSDYGTSAGQDDVVYDRGP